MRLFRKGKILTTSSLTIEGAAIDHGVIDQNQVCPHWYYVEELWGPVLGRAILPDFLLPLQEDISTILRRSCLKSG